MSRHPQFRTRDFFNGPWRRTRVIVVNEWSPLPGKVIGLRFLWTFLTERHR